MAGLASDNLLGDLYIAIHRGKSDRPIAAGAELRTTQAQDISKMMARMGQEMDRLQGIAVRADKLLSGATRRRRLGRQDRQRSESEAGSRHVQPDSTP